MTSEVRHLFNALGEEGAISPFNLKACSPGDVCVIEAHFRCRLPQAYKAFLEIAGRGAGKLFQGTDIYYPRLLSLQAEAIDLMAQNNLPKMLPDAAIVFCMHQGYEVNYFLPTSENPPVYQYVEGQPSPVQAWNSFSGFLAEALERHKAIWLDLN